MKQKTFEDFLQEWHMDTYRGTDDDAPDAFEGWLSDLAPDAWITLGETAIEKARIEVWDKSSKNTIKQALYAASPWDLGSDTDNLYRDAIDKALDA